VRAGTTIYANQNDAPEENIVGTVRPPRITRLDAWVLTGLIVAVVVLPALLTAHVGAYGIPYGDDWSYRLAAFHFYQTGHVQFSGWGAMTLVGLVVWAWPFIAIFGPHEWVLSFAASVLAACGILFAYLVARFLLSIWWSAVAVGVLASFAGLAWSTSTFMTDVPAFAAVAACLWLGITAFNRQGLTHWGLVTASMAAGLFGFSIRQFAVFAPIAVLAGLGYYQRRRGWHYAAIGVAVLLASGALYEWTSHISGYQNWHRDPLALKNLIVVAFMFFTLSLFLSPVIILASSRAWKRFRELSVLSAITVIFVGFMLLALGKGVFLGANLTQQGDLLGKFGLAGGRSNLVPSILWFGLEMLGIIAGALLVAIVASTSKPRLPPVPAVPSQTLVARTTLWVFVGTSLPVLAAFAVLNFAFDRYLWPSAFVAGVLMLDWYTRQPVGPRLAGRIGTLFAGLLLVLMLLFNAVLTLNAASFSVGVWNAGQAAVARGVPASQIDAGFAWVGTHATTQAYPRRKAYLQSEEGKYDAYFPRFRECAVVSGRPLDVRGLTLGEVRHYDEYGIFGARSLYLYLNEDLCGKLAS
jgi:Dolichyl-phosphate-mannose-protein mannosyltransferase